MSDLVTLKNFLSYKKWTRGCAARDKDSKEVEFDDERAVRWCVAGAIEKLGLNGYLIELQVAQVAYELGYNVSSLPELNDLYGYKALMKSIDEAIKRENDS